MKFYSLLFAVVLAFDCSGSSAPENKNSASNNSAATNNLQVKETPPEKTADSNTANISVNNAPSVKEDFAVKVVETEDGKSQNVQIIVDDKPKWIIKMPDFEEVNNFAVDAAKKNDKGFEIEVEYGSRYKYDKTFFFIKKDDNFYLSEIRVKSFDGADPEKWSEKAIKIDKQISLDKFEIRKYLSD
jgi:hypothetical protein